MRMNISLRVPVSFEILQLLLINYIWLQIEFNILPYSPVKHTYPYYVLCLAAGRAPCMWVAWRLLELSSSLKLL